ncbi:MAG: tetratricopeptide repeat protein [Planctomycetota bacterium]
MKSKLWIVAVTAAVILLMLGVYRATRPTSVLMTPEEAQTKLEDAAARFSAAIENDRDVAPLLKDIKLIAEQHPDLRPARVLLGQWYTQVGDRERAYEEFAAALELEPDDAALQNLAGTTAILMGDARLGETHHTLAARAEPENPRWLLPLADVMLKTERWDEARLIFLEALRLDLSLHEANAGLSDVYARRGQDGDAQRAIDQMEKARAQVFGDPDAVEDHIVYVRKLAKLYARQDDAMEAARVLNTLMPDEGRGRLEVIAELAEYLNQNGQPLAAALEYQLALDADPGNAAFAVGAARWSIEAGRLDVAEAMLDRLRAIDARHPAIAGLKEALKPGAETRGQ